MENQTMNSADRSAASVLVVDDEESLVELLTTALRFAGYEVTSEASGFDALRAVKESRPDLIVLDVNMPDLDGFEVCRRIRRDGIDSPVIFLTARDAAEDLRTGFSHGGDDYLTKPFSLEELSLRIEAILRRVRNGDDEPHRLTCGELMLDEDAHPCVKQPLDHLQLHDVDKRIAALRPGSLGGLNRGFDQAGARPIVELAICDPNQTAHLWGAISVILLFHSKPPLACSLHQRNSARRTTHVKLQIHIATCQQPLWITQ